MTWGHDRYDTPYTFTRLMLLRIVSLRCIYISNIKNKSVKISRDEKIILGDIEFSASTESPINNTTGVVLTVSWN